MVKKVLGNKVLNASIVVALVLILMATIPALAYANTAYFTGQGLIADDFGGHDLNTEICGVANGADVDGPYLLWVLTATGSKNAEITGPWGTVAITKYGNGTFKYISAWYDPDDLVAFGVFATYDGKAKNAQLVISHGCRPYKTVGAWCSPGFWMNAEDAAWALTGYTKADLFNTTVYDSFFGATFATDPSLGYVLATPTQFGGKAGITPGTSGYSLTAFNAVGAFLTNNIPGYHYDWDVMMAGNDDGCPIDHHGNFK